MPKRKKPDIVVWDEERGYYSKELTYGSNLSAPVIKIDDVKGWRQREVTNVNNQFQTKYNEIAESIKTLLDEYKWNELIYSHVEYNFLPVIGHTYHLYKRPNDALFLSLIDPNQWKMEYIGSFKLDSSNKWIKI